MSRPQVFRIIHPRSTDHRSISQVWSFQFAQDMWAKYFIGYLLNVTSLILLINSFSEMGSIILAFFFSSFSFFCSGSRYLYRYLVWYYEEKCINLPPFLHPTLPTNLHQLPPRLQPHTHSLRLPRRRHHSGFLCVSGIARRESQATKQQNESHVQPRNNTPCK